MSYRVELETRALREYKKLPSEARDSLGAVFDDLQRDPRPPGAKKLAGVDGWRVRVGSYRVLFTIDDSARIVQVYRVGHRREVYRKA